MGKTTALQHIARQLLGHERVFWWGEPRLQCTTFFPDRYQLLVQDGLDVELVRQFPGTNREEKLEPRMVEGLQTEAQFYKAADPRLMNVLLYDEEERAERVLEFLAFLNRRPGLEYVSIVIDETAKIAPGAAKREDGSFQRGLRLARILEDTGKSYVSVYMASHFPTDLWYVCGHKVQFHLAFAGTHNSKDRHSRAAHDALRVGQFYVEGPTLIGKRYDKVELAAPPSGGGPLLLRTSREKLSRMPPSKAAAVACDRPGTRKGRAGAAPSSFCATCGAGFSRKDTLLRHLRGQPTHRAQ